MIARLASLGHVFVSRMRIGRQYRIRFCTTLLYGGLQNGCLVIHLMVRGSNDTIGVNKTRCETRVTEGGRSREIQHVYAV